MKLSAYIKGCQDLLDKHGDIDRLFTSDDPEGNGFTPACYLPEVRYLNKNERESRHGGVDSLISFREEDESVEDWLDENCLDPEDVKDLEMVVLL